MPPITSGIGSRLDPLLISDRLNLNNKTTDTKLIFYNWEYSQSIIAPDKKPPKHDQPEENYRRTMPMPARNAASTEAPTWNEPKVALE